MQSPHFGSTFSPLRVILRLMTEARYWHRRADGLVQCDLCPASCVIKEGKSGACHARGVRDGSLQALAYGHVSSAGLDPIEKKPLYHFHPGRQIFSIGGWGCNLHCTFCQNWTISQQFAEGGTVYRPEQIVAAAKHNGSVGIAYTYNEPLVGFEFVFRCATLAREQGLKNVLVTNGYINPAPGAEMLPLVDALNIDIKSMDDSFYRDRCKGRVRPVLDFAVQAKEAGCWVELTNLLIPDANDSPGEVAALADWVAEQMGPATPLHLSAYHPNFNESRPRTPVSTLERAYTICRRKLSYVYMGNVVTTNGQNTACPGCGARLIVRRGYRTETVGLSEGRCGTCGRQADVIS